MDLARLRRLGYHFSWGDTLAGYRYLAYDFKDGQPLSDLRLGGPRLGGPRVGVGVHL